MNYVRIISTFSLISCLTGCAGVSPNSQSTASMHFNGTYFVCETSDIRPWVDSNTYLARENSTCSPELAAQMPSFNEFHKNPARWSNWNSYGGVEYRILGTVDKNTTYREARSLAGLATDTVAGYKITSGPLKGIMVWKR